MCFFLKIGETDSINEVSFSIQAVLWEMFPILMERDSLLWMDATHGKTETYNPND